MGIQSYQKEAAYQGIRSLLAERLSLSESEVPEELIEQTYEALMFEQELASTEEMILEQFETQALANPERVAVLWGQEAASYEQIRAGMHRVANSLLQQVMEQNVRVGVYVTNPLQRLWAILGVMRAGAVVITADPHERLSQVRTRFDQMGVSCVVCESAWGDSLATNACATVLVDRLEEDSTVFELPPFPARETDAYATITFGREVVRTQTELTDRTASWKAAFDLREGETYALWQAEQGDTWLDHAFWTLTKGAKLVLPSHAETQEALLGCLSEVQADVAYFDSSILAAILHGEQPIPEGLRAILCGSEPLRQASLDSLLANCDTDLYFCFTPGGLPLNLTPIQARPGLGHGRLSLGTPRLGRAALLDPQGHEVEEGVVGEMSLWDGRQLVTTGLKAILSSEGDWRWVESQSKSLAIVGQQICDTNRIAASLMKYSEVADAVVLVKMTLAGCSQPVAYVVLKDEGVNAGDLYEKIQADMPKAELGFKVTAVTSIPLGNGYVDETTLLKMPVVSSTEIRAIEEKIRLFPGISAATTIVVPHQIEVERLALADILPKAVVSEVLVPTEQAEKSSDAVDKISTGTDRAGRERPPAYQNGGELVIPDELPRDLSTALQETARRYPHKGLTFIDSDGEKIFLSYPDLVRRAKHILGGLQALEFKPGSRVILQVDNLAGHFAAFWACVMGGIIPATVAIPPSYQKENGVVAKIYHTWKLLEKPLILTTDRFKSSLEQMTELYSMDGLEVLTIEALEQDQAEGAVHNVQPGDLAFFQLTSGSTGAPKCIQEVHEKIIRHINAGKQCNGYEADDVSLNWLQLDHVVPILTCHLKDVYLGCSQIHVRTDYVLSDPLHWLDLIETYRVTHSWSPNFGFKIVSEALKESSDKHWDLSSLKYLMNAGEQVTLPVIKEFLNATRVFGVAEQIMQPAFGMAEVCTCMTFCNDFSRDVHAVHVLKSSLHGHIELTDESQSDDALTFVSSGRTVRGVEIRIVDGQNELLPESVIGRFQIRGGVVTPGYLNNAEANNESFVEDGWFNTGDLGFILNGELFITGREKELIIIYGANFYCHEIEEIAGQVEGVLPTFIAASGVQDLSNGTETLAIFFVADTEDFTLQIQIAQAIRANVSSKLGIAPGIVVPLEETTFLKTTSGKIQRDVMKKELLNGRYNEILKRIDLALGNENTLPNWFFRKQWVPRQLSIKMHNTVDAALILGTQDGVGGYLASLVRAGGGKAVLVEAGFEFKKLDEQHYMVDPNKTEDFAAVLSELSVAPTHFVHAWPSDVEASLEVGLYSLIRLLNAIDKNGVRALNLLLITRQAWGVLEADISTPEAAAMSGILKTMEQERPGSRCLHVDFDAVAPSAAAKAAYQELTDGVLAGEVAFRGGKRMISKLIPVELTQGQSPLPIKRGGHYLVTGGTGGIGSLTAKMLVEQFDAKVLLVARSTANAYADAWKGLSHLPDRILFFQADVANAHSLEDAVNKAESHWQAPIVGAFHFAGVMEERLLEEETPETIAQAIDGKVLGAKSLLEIFSARPGSLLVMSSSVNGTFGGFRAGAYSAANAYLDELPSAVGQADLSVYSIAWTQWEEIGMNKGSLLADLLKAKGFLSIMPKQGLASLLAALSQTPSMMMVGLNPTKRFVASRMSLPAEPGDLLRCYYSGEVQPNAVLGTLSRGDLTDGFGSVFHFDLNWLDNLPVDATGALDKSALRRLAADKEAVSTKFQEPQSPTEKKLAEIWGKILNVGKIGVSDNFFELGGHSLLATQLISRIRSQFGVEVQIDSLFINPTLEELAKQIEAKLDAFTTPDSTAALKRYEEKEKIPLSFAQERLWFLNQLSPGNPFYNIQQMIRIKGPLDWRDVEQAFKKLAERQAVLRTTFQVVGESPVQVVNDMSQAGIFDLQYLDYYGYAREETDAKVQAFAYEESQRGFDLERGPVFRSRLVRIAENEHILLFTVHHIVADAWSISILIREFLAHFQSATLPELPIEYADFSIWQREWLSGEEYDKQLKYWKNYLKGHSGSLEIKTDFPRPAMPSYKGEKLQLKIPQTQVQALEKLSQSLGVTPHMILLSVFSVLLNKYSGTEDLVVGMPIANRNRTEIEELIGFFVNTLAIRTDLSGNPTFERLVANVKDTLLGAYAHQDMPFEKLVNELQLERKLDRQPLCQVMFVMQNVPMQAMKLEGLDFELMESPHEISKYDLTLSFSETGRELIGALEYSTDLFSRESMERMIDIWNQFLKSVLENPNQKLSELMAQVEVGEELIRKFNRSISLPGVSDEEFIRALLKSRPSILSAAALTPVQRDLYLDYLRSSEGGQYGLAYSVELGTAVDADRWKAAVLQTIEETPVLKSRYFSLNGTFYQCVDTAMEVDWQFVEGDDFNSTVSRYAQPPFDLFENAVRHVLFKNRERGIYTAVLACHHIVLDAHSGHLFFQRVAAAYQRGTGGSQGKSLDVAFHNLVPLRNLSFDRSDAIAFWTEATKQVEPLVHTANVPSNLVRKPRLETIRFNVAHTEKIKQHCREQGFGVAAYFQTLLGVLLARFYQPENDFVLFDVRGGREKQEADIIGCLYQVQPIVFAQSIFDQAETSFAEILSQLLQDRRKARAHKNISVFAQKQIFGRQGVRFYTNFYNFPEFFLGENHSRLAVHESYEADEVHFIFEESADGIEIRLAFDESTWESTQMLERLERLSEQVLGGCNAFGHLEIALADEVKTITEVWNTAAVHDDSQSSLVALFTEQAERTPNAIAIRCDGAEIQYGELNRRTNRLARYLVKKGINANRLVGLFLNPSIDTIVGLIGILKAGGAYLPIDPKYPSERMKFMIQDSGVNLLLTESALCDQADLPDDVDTISLDATWSEIEAESDADLQVEVRGDQLAYVIYTSGSTGTPKGALLNHSNVVRLFSQTAQWYGFNADDVWTLFHSIAFDFSVWEIWGALLHGGTLVVVNPFVARSPYDFRELLRKEKVTVLNQTPSAFVQLIQADMTQSATNDLAIRYVIFGGEALNFTSLQPWFDRHGFEKPQLVNMYGITETTVHVTYKPITEVDFTQGSVSNIGVPIPDLQVYLLDRFGKFSPVGAVGELYVGGPGLAQGYLNRPELTADRFIENRIEPDKSGRLYKTGDIGRWTLTGEIEYLGRSDQQVKIRGFRMELGEIESRLRKLEGIDDVAVVARNNQGDEAELVAYLVSKAELSVSEIKAQLQQNLPDYMMPSAFVMMKALPLTTNGKLDRKALPAPGEFDRRSSSRFIQPESEIQELMVQAWREVLGIQKVGIEDNFYELGGHSLKLVDLQTKLNARLAGKTRPIRTMELFQYPTIRGLSGFLVLSESTESVTKGEDLASSRADKRKQLAARRRGSIK
ncbi:amino acid adenylation domain-containing protein [Paenibacillus sophorae]|uniref:Amino acid adenylation domain-containing protein n=1 Tax=Paenibacillus sophorae TaxID=1333845 RepID=A0A1H8SYQ1_9BACL|nr:non-ribosomal peptide synthetase [Paenibacillus sophorae]QWU15602.1 non-ribosomal peptide synthetase [Paenibacillus sophorae]SEO83498.1 amino acid adenylation domain-containing protein [Paenibacillus sophorae]